MPLIMQSEEKLGPYLLKYFNREFVVELFLSFYFCCDFLPVTCALHSSHFHQTTITTPSLFSSKIMASLILQCKLNETSSFATFTLSLASLLVISFYLLFPALVELSTIQTFVARVPPLVNDRHHLTTQRSCDHARDRQHLGH